MAVASVSPLTYCITSDLLPQSKGMFAFESVLDDSLWIAALGTQCPYPERLAQKREGAAQYLSSNLYILGTVLWPFNLHPHSILKWE